MKRRSLVDVIGGYDLNESGMQTYQFYKDDADRDPVEIDADDEDDAKKKIKQITKKDPDKVIHWRKTKPGEKPIEEYDEEEDEQEPDEYDAFITTSGDQYTVSVNKKHLGDVVEYEEAVELLVAWMNRNKYYPPVWLVSDHGNYEVDSSFPWDRIVEENSTDNLDGGLGQPRTPLAFQRNKPTRSDKRKEYENATASTGFGVVANPRGGGKYSKKLESMRHRLGVVISESMITGIQAVGVMRELKGRTTADKHREQIALSTLRMPAPMAGVMGDSMTAEDAIVFLKSLGYTDQDISKFGGNRVVESRYSDWANDVSATPTQKINKSIQEVNRKLYEIETMVNHVMKFKSESGLESSVYWKPTLQRFSKISERLLRVGNKLRELNK